MSDTPPRTTRGIFEKIHELTGYAGSKASGQIRRLANEGMTLAAAPAALPWVTRPPTVTKTLVKRDYWVGESYRPYTNVLYQEGVQIAASDLIREMLTVLTDGDEFTISVTVTGNRPFGDRRIVYQGPHKYGEETDEQYTARVDPPASLRRVDAEGGATCLSCGHAFHGKLSCLNMASDNDCDCTGGTE